MTPPRAGAETRREMPDPRIEVRHCHGLEEFEACVEVQKRVWDAADIDVVPLPLFVVAAETGGQVLGAFAEALRGRELVGFTMAIAGARERKAFLHSHMTAVLEGYRDQGVGRRLKLFQRQDALARGIDLVEWTFDPLELKNAYFNFMRLGALARRFIPNCYGITTSPLHGSLPTDRLLAEWQLSSPRVVQILGEARSGEGPYSPAAPVPNQEIVRIHVPAGIAYMRQYDPTSAAQEQRRIREEFQDYFHRGFTATGIEITPKGGDYLLEPCVEL